MANPSDLYNAAVEKGQLLFGLLQQRLDTPAAHDTETASLQLNYRIDTSPGWPGMIRGQEPALRNEGLELEGGGWITAGVSSRTANETAYTNLFAPGQGSIVCWANDKIYDGNQPSERLEWSQTLFQTFQTLALQPTPPLKTIWRYCIINKETRQILDEARLFGHPREDAELFTEYCPGDSGFFAICGCPNGTGVVRMLTDHCDALGGRTIAAVRVPKGANAPAEAPPMLYFVLADQEKPSKPKGPKGVKRSAAGQKRAAKRQKREHPERNQDSSPSIMGSAYL